MHAHLRLLKISWVKYFQKNLRQGTNMGLSLIYEEPIKTNEMNLYGNMPIRFVQFLHYFLHPGVFPLKFFWSLVYNNSNSYTWTIIYGPRRWAKRVQSILRKDLSSWGIFVMPNVNSIIDHPLNVISIGGIPSYKVGLVNVLVMLLLYLKMGL